MPSRVFSVVFFFFPSLCQFLQRSESGSQLARCCLQAREQFSWYRITSNFCGDVNRELPARQMEHEGKNRSSVAIAACYLQLGWSIGYAARWLALGAFLLGQGNPGCVHYKSLLLPPTCLQGGREPPRQLEIGTWYLDLRGCLGKQSMRSLEQNVLWWWGSFSYGSLSNAFFKKNCPESLMMNRWIFNQCPEGKGGEQRILWPRESNPTAPGEQMGHVPISPWWVLHLLSLGKKVPWEGGLDSCFSWTEVNPKAMLRFPYKSWGCL